MTLLWMPTCGFTRLLVPRRERSRRGCPIIPSNDGVSRANAVSFQRCPTRGQLPFPSYRPPFPLQMAMPNHMPHKVLGAPGDTWTGDEHDSSKDHRSSYPSNTDCNCANSRPSYLSNTDCRFSLTIRQGRIVDECSSNRTSNRRTRTT